MDEKTSAEIMVLVAADRWAREAMRSDKELDFTEQRLLDAVMHHRIISKAIGEDIISSIPKPPFVPKDFSPEMFNSQTMRYSDRSTIPTPAGGFEAPPDGFMKKIKKDKK